MAEDVRERILGATIVCLGRFGIAKTTVDDAARTAGVARATVYRHFPDGRDQLIGESITWAVGQFFHDLFLAVADDTDIAVLLEHALTEAHRAVGEHAVLQKVLETERTRLTAEDSLASADADVLTAIIQLYKALGGGWQAAPQTTDQDE